MASTLPIRSDRSETPSRQQALLALDVGVGLIEHGPEGVERWCELDALIRRVVGDEARADQLEIQRDGPASRFTLEPKAHPFERAVCLLNFAIGPGCAVPPDEEGKDPEPAQHGPKAIARPLGLGPPVDDQVRPADSDLRTDVVGSSCDGHQIDDRHLAVRGTWIVRPIRSRR
jgi:hypothetical protein